MNKVLIVEDSELSVDILKILLEKYGLEIDVVENGELALDYYKNSLHKSDPYELIFLDIMMPKKDGQEVLEEIRRIEKTYKNAKTKIIMTTSLDNFDNVYKSFKNKCDGYLIKPILKEKLDLLMKSIT